MSADRIKIDDTYTYVFDEGYVSLERHGTEWLTNPMGSKAWIAAANEIERLRAEVARLTAPVAGRDPSRFYSGDEVEWTKTDHYFGETMFPGRRGTVIGDPTSDGRTVVRVRLENGGKVLAWGDRLRKLEVAP